MTRSMCAACGEWLINEDITGFNIQGIDQSLQNNGDACMRRCQEQPSCNAVVYKKYSKECWLKTVPSEGLWSEPLENPESNSLVLCPSQIPGSDGGEGGMSTAALAGIVTAGVVVVVACIVGLIAWLIAVRKRRKSKEERKPVRIILPLVTVHDQYKPQIFSAIDAHCMNMCRNRIKMAMHIETLHKHHCTP